MPSQPDNIIELPVRSRETSWASLGEFSGALWRDTGPDLFLSLHRAGSPEDRLVRHVFCWAASVCPRKVSGLAGLFSSELPLPSGRRLLQHLAAPACLTEILQHCGTEPLDMAGYRLLARWAGHNDNDEAGADAERVALLTREASVDSSAIAALSLAAPVFFPIMKGRDPDEVIRLNHVLQEMLPRLDLEPRHARELVTKLLRGKDYESAVAEIRTLTVSSRRIGAFNPPPRLLDNAFSIITRPSISAPHLQLRDSLSDRLLFERSFIVGERSETEAGFSAYTLLDALHPAGNNDRGSSFLLSPVILDGSGHNMEEHAASRVRDKLLRSCADRIWTSAPPFPVEDYLTGSCREMHWS